MPLLIPEPVKTRASDNAMIPVLQVFNQYLEPGGEEVWVNEISGFSGRGFVIDDLRFQSSDWKRKDAPARLIKAVDTLWVRRGLIRPAFWSVTSRKI